MHILSQHRNLNSDLQDLFFLYCFCLSSPNFLRSLLEGCSLPAAIDAATCEAELLLSAEVLTVSYIFYPQNH